MKRFVLPFALLLTMGLLGCIESSQPESNTDSPPSPSTVVKKADPPVNTTVPTLPIMVDTFTTDELFEAGGGGCGMSLWKPDSNTQQDGFLFFNGLDESPALMVFDGEITPLRRTSASGEKFYGQQTDQTFETENGAIAIQVNVTLGEIGEIESVSIPNGTISIETQGQQATFPIVGDAGC